MRKKTKIISVACILVLMFCMLSVGMNVQADEGLQQIDGSYLTQESESIGYDTKITRGEDLLTGYSKCVRLGNGKLYVGGSTIASYTVERVGVAVLVERAQEDDESWESYDGWIKFNENADMVSSNRQLDVEGGYYYRVRCTHSANDDVSSSFTDGIYIE
ncbi:MAG: hypothetical protein ACI4S2_12645 [Lachnospiraceae bacterium]